MSWSPLLFFGCEEVRDLHGPDNCSPETKERPHAVGSSYRDINSAERGTLAARRLQMSDSKHSRVEHRNKPVRESIEAERERAKRHGDEVATSSDDSFPASDPPSFIGVTSAADVEKKKKKAG